MTQHVRVDVLRQPLPDCPVAQSRLDRAWRQRCPFARDEHRRDIGLDRAIEAYIELGAPAPETPSDRAATGSVALDLERLGEEDAAANDFDGTDRPADEDQLEP